MVYILDTNIFRKLLDHFPKKGVYFKQVWQAFENGIQKGIYQSVDECYNELSARYDDKNGIVTIPNEDFYPGYIFANYVYCPAGTYSLTLTGSKDVKGTNKTDIIINKASINIVINPYKEHYKESSFRRSLHCSESKGIKRNCCY